MGPVAVVLTVVTVAVVLAVVAEEEAQEKDGRRRGTGEKLEPQLSEVGGKLFKSKTSHGAIGVQVTRRVVCPRHIFYP